MIQSSNKLKQTLKGPSKHLEEEELSGNPQNSIIKHCGKFKARLVADGHLTKEPNEAVYSGVVSFRNLRLAMFLAELNDLQLWGEDVGNAYLQALTKEMLYIVAGPEFEELQGHVLVMYKALYGTRSGACWHDNCFDILQQMDFKTFKSRS